MTDYYIYVLAFFLLAGLVGCGHKTTIIETEPVGARVFVDGEMQEGNTPLAVDLEGPLGMAESRDIRIIKPGYKVYKIHIKRVWVGAYAQAMSPGHGLQGYTAIPLWPLKLNITLNKGELYTPQKE